MMKQFLDRRIYPAQAVAETARLYELAGFHLKVNESAEGCVVSFSSEDDSASLRGEFCNYLIYLVSSTI